MDKFIRWAFVVFVVAIISLMGFKFFAKPDTPQASANQSATTPAKTAVKPKFKIAWSIYAGWMPWDYANKKGIIQKWADKYNLDIEIVQVNDYIQSINQYTSGDFAGVTITNMDALTIAAAGGVDSTAVIVGDYSNGNDGILLKNGHSVADLKGKKVNLVEYSVSHDLLSRALEKNNLSLKDVTTVNSADANLASAFSSNDVPAIVTWNPILDVAKKQKDAHLIFSSKDIPGEILDLLLINTQVLKQNPDLGKALTGAWYETLSVMQGNDESAKAARAFMAEAAGTDLPSFETQLASTYFFNDSRSAAAFFDQKQLLPVMERVETFAFDNHLLGDKAKDNKYIGIETPEGIWGDPNNVKLRFNRNFTDESAQGKL